MGEKITYDYFYGGQLEAFSYYRLPRVLVTGQQFRGLSTDAKLLYALLLDRMGLSSRNGWYDEQGRVYIYYPVEEIEEDIGGDPAATAMSVTVPTVLPIAVGTDGTVTTATDAKITNNSYGAVKVSAVSIQAAQGWHLTDFGTNMANEKVDSDQVGFALTIGGGERLATSSTAGTQTLLAEAIEGCYMTGAGNAAGSSVAISYDAVVSPVSSAVTNTGVASVIFTVEWDI